MREAGGALAGAPLRQPCGLPPPRTGEDLAGLACAALGWSPDQFWAATPAELASVVGALGGEQAVPVDGGLLGRLREAFPDG